MKDTCQQCCYILKNEWNIYICLKNDKTIMGLKEVHPLFPACEMFKDKTLDDVAFFKADRFY